MSLMDNKNDSSTIDFSIIFDNMRAVIFICDSRQIIVNVNEACNKYLKKEKCCFIGRKITDFLIIEDRPKFEALMLSVENDKDYWELNFQTDDMDFVILNCYKIKQGDFTCVIGRCSDPRVNILQQELMLINNQVTNLYREIEKKNKQLVSLNSILEQQKAEIDRKNTVLNNQLLIARKIQQHLVRKGNFKLYNLNFKMDYIPAYRIGGDYFDVVDLKNGKVGVFISDVSGHGISAALIMAIIKTIFTKQKEAYDDPSKLLGHMNMEFNEIFGDGFEEIYCTAFYCVIDTIKMSIEYCNAGNPGAYIFDNKIKNKMDEGNLPLGMFENSKYTSNHTSYNLDDKIAFFTDGFEEIILQCNYETIDNNSLLECLNDNCLGKIIKEDEKLKDDISLVIVEVKGE